MKENTRTGLYLAAALVALSLAWWARPAGIKYETLDDSGSRFFPQFDPLEAKSLEIVAIDPETVSRRAFKVAQQNGRWQIPSREGYPADAQDHLARAATSVMDVTKGTIVSDSPADQELFGVADPTVDGPSGAPSLGSGTRVTLKNVNGNTLVDLIIGKTVKDKPELRYTRVPGRDRIYTAAVNMDSLSTKFQDWIERDLLQMSGSQISEVVIDDYSIDTVNQRILRGEKLDVRRDAKTGAWSLQPPESLREGESLQTAKLDTLQGALNNLQIVDVYRKPAGLSSQLQTETTMQVDGEAIASLASRGYYIVGNQLLSNKGETKIRTADGVEYVLRFGEVVNYDSGGITDAERSANKPSSEPGRYLFVTAQFNDSLIEKPQYDVVPEAPASQPAAPTDGAAGEQASPSSDAETHDKDASADPPAAVQDAARNAIIEANEKKRKDYEQKIADGQEKVKKLNARFADWYYVVSDAVYQQIRLKRNDVVSTTTEHQDEPAAPQP